VLVKVHVKRDTRLVFFEDRDGEAEAHDGEIHRSSTCDQWRESSSFASALIANPACARTCQRWASFIAATASSASTSKFWVHQRAQKSDGPPYNILTESAIG
jgi:hypothetical protein